MRKRNRLEDRLSAADIRARGALDAFESTATILDAAAAAADEVVKEAEVEVLRLRAVRDDAFRQAASHAAKAKKIREFL